MDIGREAALTGLRDHDAQGANDPELGAIQCLNGRLTGDSRPTAGQVAPAATPNIAEPGVANRTRRKLNNRTSCWHPKREFGHRDREYIPVICHIKKAMCDLTPRTMTATYLASKSGASRDLVRRGKP
jgi:hypothetical protein